MKDILIIDELTKSFTLHNQQKHIKVLAGIGIKLREGEFIGITGKSGSGKSTIFKCIYRTYLSDSGSISYNSKKFGWVNLSDADERTVIYLRKHEIGYVSQFLNIMPRTTAIELIEQAVSEMGHDEVSARMEAKKMLTHFELDEKLWDSYPGTFSGGERLRLNIARAMAKHPRLLLLDEPTASLDNSSKLKVRQLVEQLINEGTTMLGIFHDIEFMENLCNREYKMTGGTLEPVADRGTGYEG